jgi:hypothetical protein
MTIAMSEHVDAEPCDVLRGGDGPVYFLLGGRLYVVHEILGRWIEPDSEPRRLPARRVPATGDIAGSGGASSDAAKSDIASSRRVQGEAEEGEMSEPPQVEHWLVVASVGRFGTPAVFRLQRRPAPPANGPDTWTARAEKR